MGVNEIIEFINAQGFPIAVCVWFAFRNEKMMNKISDNFNSQSLNTVNAISELSKVVAILTSKLNCEDVTKVE